MTLNGFIRVGLVSALIVLGPACADEPDIRASEVAPPSAPASSQSLLSP